MRYPVHFTRFPDGVSRPVIRLQLITPAGKQLLCYGIVDSGADLCTFPLSFALQLGLNPLTAPRQGKIGGVGNQSNVVYFWQLAMDFGPFSISAEVGFTDGLEAWGLALLGQSGFFDRMYVEIDNRQSMFYLTYP